MDATPGMDRTAAIADAASAAVCSAEDGVSPGLVPEDGDVPLPENTQPPRDNPTAKVAAIVHRASGWGAVGLIMRMTAPYEGVAPVSALTGTGREVGAGRGGAGVGKLWPGVTCP